MKRIVLTAVCVFVVSGVMAAAAAAPAITQRSIDGARIGLRASSYTRLFGKPSYKDTVPDLPTHWSRLVFGPRGLSVYFKGSRPAAADIATWNRTYKTAAGVGPCSTLSELKLAYGAQLKPSKFNTQHGVVYAYTVGKNLIFSVENHSYVGVVVLYNGSDPRVNKPGGSRSYAGAISLIERTCHRE
jgi:hypothetical protein